MNYSKIFSNKSIWVDSIMHDIPTVSISPTGKKIPLKTYGELPEIKYSRISAKTKFSSICDFIALDIETTGLSCNSNIIEVSAVKFENFKPIEAFTSLCKCDRLPAKITQLTGINKDMLANSPYFYQLIPELQNYISGYNLVGHNLPFDLSCLMVRGLDVFLEKRKFFDTLQIARSKISGPNYGCPYNFEKHTIENFKLDTLANFCGLIRSSAHRSLSDAVTAGLLFYELYDTYILMANNNLTGKL